MRVLSVVGFFFTTLASTFVFAEKTVLADNSVSEGDSGWKNSGEFRPPSPGRDYAPRANSEKPSTGKVDSSSSNFNKTEKFIPGEEVITPTGKTVKVWSTDGPVKVNRPPTRQDWSGEDSGGLSGDVHIVIDEDSRRLIDKARADSDHRRFDTGRAHGGHSDRHRSDRAHSDLDRADRPRSGDNRGNTRDR